MRPTKDAARKAVSPIPEMASEPVHFCRRILLQNSVTLLFDDRRGLAEGSDGRIYYAVCREYQDEGDSLEIVGWSAEVTAELVSGGEDPGPAGSMGPSQRF